MTPAERHQTLVRAMIDYLESRPEFDQVGVEMFWDIARSVVRDPTDEEIGVAIGEAEAILETLGMKAFADLFVAMARKLNMLPPPPEPPPPPDLMTPADPVWFAAGYLLTHPIPFGRPRVAILQRKFGLDLIEAVQAIRMAAETRKQRNNSAAEGGHDGSDRP